MDAKPLQIHLCVDAVCWYACAAASTLKSHIRTTFIHHRMPNENGFCCITPKCLKHVGNRIQSVTLKAFFIVYFPCIFRIKYNRSLVRNCVCRFRIHFCAPRSFALHIVRPDCADRCQFVAVGSAFAFASSFSICER